MAYIDKAIRFNPENESDVLLFEELAKLLYENKCENRFGITLLHYHFPVNEDEILLERFEKSENASYKFAINTKEISSDFIRPLAWRFIDNEILPVEYVDLTFTNKNFKYELLQNENECLSQIGQLLKKKSCENRFGVCFLNSPFRKNKNYTIMESTDEESRIQKLYPISKKDTSNINAIQTVFKLNYKLISVYSGCKLKYETIQECKRWCEEYQKCGHDSDGNGAGWMEHVKKRHTRINQKRSDGIHYN